MGEVADAMIDGSCCAICGQYFENDHGYPVACKDCWEPDCGYQKATEEIY